MNRPSNVELLEIVSLLETGPGTRIVTREASTVNRAVNALRYFAEKPEKPKVESLREAHTRLRHRPEKGRTSHDTDLVAIVLRRLDRLAELMLNHVNEIVTAPSLAQERAEIAQMLAGTEQP